MPISAADKKWISELIAEKLAAQKVELIDQIAPQSHDTASLSATITAAVKAAIAPLEKKIAELNVIISKKAAELSCMKIQLTDKDAKIKKLEADVIAASQRNVELHSTILEKADDSESYSRKDSLRVSGVIYHAREDNAALQTKVIAKLAENNVTIDERDIFRLHHCGKPVAMNKFHKFLNNVNDTKIDIDESDRTMTAEVIVKFSNWRAGSQVYALHHRKDLQIRVNVDSTKYRRDLLADIRSHIKQNHFKAYAYINAECRIVVRDVDADQRSFIQNWDSYEALTESFSVDPNFGRR